MLCVVEYLPELNFIINPDHLQLSSLIIADAITRDDDYVHNLRTYLRSLYSIKKVVPKNMCDTRVLYIDTIVTKILIQ